MGPNIEGSMLDHPAMTKGHRHRHGTRIRESQKDDTDIREGIERGA
jgi:hypothetical protein